MKIFYSLFHKAPQAAAPVGPSHFQRTHELRVDDQALTEMFR